MLALDHGLVYLGPIDKIGRGIKDWGEILIARRMVSNAHHADELLFAGTTWKPVLALAILILG